MTEATQSMPGPEAQKPVETRKSEIVKKVVDVAAQVLIPGYAAWKQQPDFDSFPRFLASRIANTTPIVEGIGITDSIMGIAGVAGADPKIGLAVYGIAKGAELFFSWQSSIKNAGANILQ